MFLGTQGEKGTNSYFQRALNEICFLVQNCSDNRAIAGYFEMNLKIWSIVCT